MAVYKRNNSQFYFIGFEYQGKRYRVSARTTSRRQAEQYEAQLHKQVYDEEVLGKTTHEPMRFEDAVKRYATTHLKTRERLEKNASSQAYVLARLVRLIGPDTILDEITTEVVANVKEKVFDSGKKKPSTANQYLAFLRAILRMKYRDDGFLYLCRELRNDALNFYKHRYTVRDRKFRPGQGGRNVSTDWTGFDEAIFKNGPDLSMPPMSVWLQPRELTPEEREKAGRIAHQNWVAVRLQNRAAGEPIDDADLRPWDELADAEKDTFWKAGESLALPDAVMWDLFNQMRKKMGEKAFRKKLFEVSLSVAIERMMPDWSEAERYRATDYIVKLAGMLDVPPEKSADGDN